MRSVLAPLAGTPGDPWLCCRVAHFGSPIRAAPSGGTRRKPALLSLIDDYR